MMDGDARADSTAVIPATESGTRAGRPVKRRRRRSRTRTRLGPIQWSVRMSRLRVLRLALISASVLLLMAVGLYLGLSA
jgi:hypothetical protein